MKHIGWARKSPGGALPQAALPVLQLLVLVAALALLSAARAETIKLPLQKLSAQPTMELRCVSDAKSIDIPIPERWAVRSISVQLRYMLSMNMVSENSQLLILMNNVAIAQARLNAQAPDVSLGVTVPVNLVVPGYNRLTFQVVQHYSRNKCEAPCAPDLWTSINLAESFVQIDYSLKPVPLQLSALSSAVFDPRILPQGEVNVITEDLSAERLTVASIVASGIARRFDYRNVVFHVSDRIRPGMDNALVGGRAFVDQFLERNGAPTRAIDGGYLRLLHLPGGEKGADPRHVLLVVSGADANAEKIAAVTFANITFPFPGGDELKAYEFSLPGLAKYSGRHVLTAGRSYDFKTLNLPTLSFKGLNPGPRELAFRLPADFYIRPNHYAKLSLQFAYGAGMRSADSSLVVGVNGRGVRAIPLARAGGDFIERYQLDVPTYVFKPGPNTISFTPHFSVTGEICDLLQTDGLFLTLFDNSTLEFPDMPHFVEMPRMDLFMYNGFPFTRWPDGFETSVLLGEKDPNLAAAALNLVGMITQKNGFPLFETRVTYGTPRPGEVLALGRIGTLPEALRQAAPFNAETTAMVPYPVVRTWENEVKLAYSKQSGALGSGRALLTMFQSPSQPGRTVLMLTGETIDDVLAGSEAMLDPAVQARGAGDVVLIERAEPEHKITALSVSARYVTGERGRFSAFESFFYTNPWLYYAAIGLASMLFLLGLYLWLRVRRSRKIGAAKE